MIKIPIHPSRLKDRNLRLMARQIESLARTAEVVDRIYCAVNLKLFNKIFRNRDR